LWHNGDPELGPDEELRQGLVAAVGSQVSFDITHIDYAPHGMAAAKVQVRLRAVWFPADVAADVGCAPTPEHQLAKISACASLCNNRPRPALSCSP